MGNSKRYVLETERKIIRPDVYSIFHEPQFYINIRQILR